MQLLRCPTRLMFARRLTSPQRRSKTHKKEKECNITITFLAPCHFFAHLQKIWKQIHVCCGSSACEHKEIDASLKALALPSLASTNFIGVLHNALAVCTEIDKGLTDTALIWAAKHALTHGCEMLSQTASRNYKTRNECHAEIHHLLLHWAR